MMLSKYKDILKKEGVSAKDMAELLGMTYSTYRSCTRPSKSAPKWMRAFVIGYELSKQSELTVCPICEEITCECDIPHVEFESDKDEENFKRDMKIYKTMQSRKNNK